MSGNLKGVYIIERDVNEELFTWAFPSLDLTLESVLKARSGLAGPSSSFPAPAFLDRPFVSKYKDQWLYMITSKLPVAPESTDATAPSSHLTAFSVILVADNFNFLQYKPLLAFFSSEFAKTLSSTSILPAFISASASGRALLDSTKWVATTFDPRASLVSPIASLIRLLGIESVLLFVASVTNQRVWVHHTNPEELSNYVRAIPCFGAWHRNNWDCLRPVISSPSPMPSATLPAAIAEAELQDITSASPPVTAVGTLNSDFSHRSDLWDIYVDIPSSSVTISDAARSKFAMGKYHKTIAEGLMTLAQLEEGSDVVDEVEENARNMRIIKFCVHKTKELIEQVKACAEAVAEEGIEEGETKYIVTSASIRERGVPPAMEAFLLLVAAAEGFVAKQ